jgi:3',5'-cyclic AMP phosphodiesterase CpdA
MTRRIAHLSDLHFGAIDPGTVEALLEALIADPPDIVAISGDLTMAARRREYRAARAFLDALPCPVLAVPGNHDVSPYLLHQRFLDPFARWRRFVAPHTEPVWQDAALGIVGINTARRGGLYLDWSRGRIERDELARAEAKLAALPEGLFRIVVAHHPFVVPERRPGARLVGGAARALAAFARQGVRLLLSGHLHVGDIARQERGMLIVQASTATSTRLRGEPNAWNMIRIQGGEASVAHHVWQDGVWSTQETTP